jgi:predicted cobalt transporter CbtA
MNQLSLGTILKSAIIAAVVAGLLVGIFHRIATEPVIDHAIMLEEQASAHGAPAEEPAVGRDTQRFGLFVGMLLYGLTWALFFAVAYQLTQGWLPASTAPTRAMLLALAAYVGVALFPFLKYPANPPGVGEPESIVLRQGLYLLALAIGIAGVGVALKISQSLQDRGVIQWAAPVGFLVGFGLIAYLALPGNPDAIRMPEEVVTSFRMLSLIGLTLFWALFGATFGWLTRQAQPGARGAAI